ncbi:PRC-barrel domain-containing protein [Nocardioides astragali]|uniref:PRC-barrel domain-containing protein n=1 Tax=Nocardioides astragali TaxID=1776736 RepID=A0ABW2N122_9ACTN|nr:PRC-barrel domain-containing protein [Nocardioides astragali]
MTKTLELVALGDTELDLADERDDVRGMTVLDPRGHRIGEVDEILMDERERRARLLVVASGGILDLCAHRRLVPVEAVDQVGATVRLERSDLHVETGFDYDPDLARPVDYRAVYAYFGYSPFWEGKHATPYFHDRRW